MGKPKGVGQGEVHALGQGWPWQRCHGPAIGALSQNGVTRAIGLTPGC
jgi:hypothetical protein